MAYFLSNFLSCKSFGPKIENFYSWFAKDAQFKITNDLKSIELG